MECKHEWSPSSSLVAQSGERAAQAVAQRAAQHREANGSAGAHKEQRRPPKAPAHRMKPRSKSLWMTPAACGAVNPALIVHARVSFSPARRVSCLVS